MILSALGQYSASWKQAQRAGDEGWGYDNHGLNEVDMGSASATNQGDELIEMAQARFGELTDAEKKLLQAQPGHGPGRGTKQRWIS